MYKKLAIILFSISSFSVFSQGQIAKNVISVSAVGEASSKPDVAFLNLRITALDKTQSCAQSSMDKKMRELQKVLKKNSIADKDIQSRSYNIHEENEWRKGKKIPKGYRASQSLRVKYRKISKLSLLLKQLGNLNKLNIESVAFGLNDDSQLKLLAIEDALKKAKRKAAHIARLSGRSLGKVISVSEGRGGAQPRPPMMMMAKSRGGGAESASSPV